MAAPRVLYIIASTMRTGSYLLCEGLEATGRAGHPREIFCPERRENYAGEWQLPPDVPLDQFAHAALGSATTENGVCGMKIHGHHVEPLARECGWAGSAWQSLRWMFPTARYIYLRRRDRRAQAISWYRAEATNQWWRIPGVEDPASMGSPEPEYDGVEIRRRELELDRQEKAWRAFFAAGPTELMTMEYESLEANYRGEVARALAFLGEDAALAKSLPEPRMTRQRDALTDEWMQRMNAEFPPSL